MNPAAGRADAARPGHRGARDRGGPRNYLAPAERRRLFWTVMPAGLLLLLVLGWVERAWFPRRPATSAPQVDTRLEAVAPGASPDAVVIEADAAPLDVPAAAELAASLDSLGRVRDATVFRDTDNDAWFQVWTTLRVGGQAALARARPREVTFRELFGQPRSFRGRLVRMRGRLHRTEQLTAPSNDYGIDRYWQCWLEPAGGPSSPVVIQCLSLPEGMLAGMDIDEPVEVTGYFFKNFAYNAADAIRVAPVIMTLEPFWKPPAAAPGTALAGRGGVTLVVTVTLAALVAATWWGAARAGRRTAVTAAEVVGLDEALAHVEPVTVEESLRRVAAGDGAGGGPDKETTR